MARGRVYLVGAGPFAQDLITVRGKKVLEQAEVVVYDYLVDKNILKDLSPDVELVCAEDLRKKALKGEDEVERINDFIIKRVKEGKRVVRLKNGDPFIFAHADEEMKALLKEKILFSVVPGVTAATAAACFAGVPLTAREFSSSVVLLTAQEAPNKKRTLKDWAKIAYIETIVIYMGVHSISYVVDSLLQVGKDRDTPALVVAEVTRISQRIVYTTLKDLPLRIKEEKVNPPAIIILGEVVRRYKQFNWFCREKKVLFTGLSDRRFFEQGIIYHLPLIEIQPLKDYVLLDMFIQRLADFDWIVFMSRYGVIYFFQRLFYNGKDSRTLHKIKVAAIGNSTAAKLKEYGIIADLVPKKECAQGLIEAFKKIELKGKKIFLPRSNLGDKGIYKALKAQGADVYPCVIYKNVMPKDLEEIDFSFLDEIIFSSPSTVRNFKRRYKRLPPHIKLRWLGEVTRREIEKQFLT